MQRPRPPAPGPRPQAPGPQARRPARQTKGDVNLPGLRSLGLQGLGASGGPQGQGLPGLPALAAVRAERESGAPSRTAPSSPKRNRRLPFACGAAGRLREWPRAATRCGRALVLVLGLCWACPADWGPAAPPSGASPARLLAGPSRAGWMPGVGSAESGAEAWPVTRRRTAACGVRRAACVRCPVLGLTQAASPRRWPAGSG